MVISALRRNALIFLNGYTLLVVPPKETPYQLCEAVIETMPELPKIRHLGNEAYYHPFFDLVNMPGVAWFQGTETYYATLFHQLVHSTGHKSRLYRKKLIWYYPEPSKNIRWRN